MLFLAVCLPLQLAELARQAEADRLQFAELMAAKEEEVQLLQETLREQQQVYKEALTHIGQQQQMAQQYHHHQQQKQQQPLSSHSADPETGELLAANEHLHSELEDLRTKAASRLSDVSEQTDDTEWTKAGTDPRGN
eukprot:SAG22_NODE_750_length_7481_cov_19.618667_5_plen_137_part_00